MCTRAPCLLSSSLSPSSPLSLSSHYASFLSHTLSKPQPATHYMQKRYKSKKTLLRELKTYQRLKTKHSPSQTMKQIHKNVLAKHNALKAPQEDGWIPLANSPQPPKTPHEPSIYTPPPSKEDNAHEQTILDALEKMGFLEKLKSSKDNSWAKAFFHKYYENKVTSPVEREYTQKGTTALETALREYLFLKYPLLPAQAMLAACKWFSSPIATARFAKILKLDELIFFKFEVATLRVESDYAAYSMLEPAERVTLLAATYASLIGIIYEEGGIGAVIPLVDQQVRWVEGLKINFITEKEPISKTAERKKKLAAALQSPFPQPRAPLQNWMLSSFNPLYEPANRHKPKDIAETYLSRYGYGSPEYRVIRESNRLSPISAVFLVGAFKVSDNSFIAQGFGGSIKQAENEAAKAALRLVSSKTSEKYTVAPINYLKM